MDKLNLPAYKFRISGTQKNNTLIFDTFRKKFISLTPEEWVRQHILRFLTEEKSVPEALVSVEAGININRLAKRYDALIFDRNGKPWMIVECKAPSVAINQSVFDHFLRGGKKVYRTNSGGGSFFRRLAFINAINSKKFSIKLQKKIDELLQRRK